jgi:hypothetical protein
LALAFYITIALFLNFSFLNGPYPIAQYEVPSTVLEQFDLRSTA